jgi:hypothetical protein
MLMPLGCSEANPEILCQLSWICPPTLYNILLLCTHRSTITRPHALLKTQPLDGIYKYMKDICT